MKLASIDIETWGDLPEYALQPYRLRRGEARITSVAAVDADGVEWATLNPTKEQVRNWLQRQAASGARVVGHNSAFDIAWFLAWGLRDEVYAIRWLDTLLMWRHLCVRPDFAVPEGTRQSFSLKNAVRQYLPQYSDYEKDVSFDPSVDPDKLLEYNKLDAVLTLKLAQMFWDRMTPKMKRLAQIEAAAIPMVAEGMVEGLHINTNVATELANKLEGDANGALVKLMFTEGSTITKEVLNSPKQLSELLYQKWGLKCPKLTDKGASSTDKEALWTLAHEDPRARLVKEHREAVGNRKKFAENLLVSVDYNGDGRTRPQPRIYSTYCVPGDVEVLTHDGWVRLDSWDGSSIAQVDSHGGIEFLPATRFIGPVVEDWVGIKSKNVKCLFTHGHTIPYYSQKHCKWSTTMAGKLLGGRRTFDLPLAGKLRDFGFDNRPELTPEQMRVLAAVQADGYLHTPKGRKRPNLRFTLKRPRKIERLRQLLRAVGIHPREYVCAKYPDRVEFHITATNLPSWVSTERKTFGSWTLTGGSAGVEALLDELVHWDGSARQDGGVRYTSSNEANVTWVATLAALSGRKCSLHKPQTQQSGRELYCCHLSDPEQRPVSTVKTHLHVCEVRRTGRAYCATTQTGFWLARSQGTIFVTGNTGRMTYSSKQGKGKSERQTGFAIHQMKRDPAFRRTIIPPPGYTLLEFDFAGQEFRWMAVVSGDPDMLKLCQPGEDAHAYMGAQIAGWSYASMRTRLAEGDSEAKAKRQLGKVANLSCAYRTGAKRLRTVAQVQHDTPMTEDEAQAIHLTYRTTYRYVPRYWARQIRHLRANGFVENLIGRRVYLGQPHEWKPDLTWSYESTSINFPIQSIGAEQKYLAILVLRETLPQYDGRLYFELHDGLFCVVPDEKAEKAAAHIKRLLSNLPYKAAWDYTPPIPFPVDAKLGTSWGDLKEFHP